MTEEQHSKTFVYRAYVLKLNIRLGCSPAVLVSPASSVFLLFSL
jgi:hypothetical protein